MMDFQVAGWRNLKSPTLQKMDGDDLISQSPKIQGLAPITYRTSDYLEKCEASQEIGWPP